MDMYLVIFSEQSVRRVEAEGMAAEILEQEVRENPLYVQMFSREPTVVWCLGESRRQNRERMTAGIAELADFCSFLGEDASSDTIQTQMVSMVKKLRADGQVVSISALFLYCYRNSLRSQ